MEVRDKPGEIAHPYPMLGDKRRAAIARSLLRVREAREQSFPGELFDEHAWNILLHLFCALSENETVTEADLIRRSGAKLPVGRSWLKHLVADGQVVARQDGDDVELTETAVTRMRTFLDAALAIHSAAISI